MLRAIANSLSSIIHPQECRVCSGGVDDLDDGVACAACWNETTLFNGNEMLCKKCGAFFASEAAPVPVSCHKCDEYLFEKAIALGIYEKALSASILNLKKVPDIPKRLAKIIDENRASDVLAFADVLIPIPLSQLRRHERGFNQAEVIADEVSRVTGIPVDRLSVARKVHTQMHRIGMDQKARELTIHNAFEVTRPKLVAGKKIVLVDDVLTSGATASQAAKVLKKSGAERVDVFTLARAVLR